VSTLDPRDARIAKLEALLEAALERIAQLEEENQQLREENRQLREENRQLKERSG
jgi:transposase